MGNGLGGSAGSGSGSGSSTQHGAFPHHQQLPCAPNATYCLRLLLRAPGKVRRGGRPTNSSDPKPCTAPPLPIDS